MQDRAPVDAAVVGGGITGLVTALLLRQAGARVAVLERHTIGGVATRNTTAKVSALQGTVYSELTSRRGPDVAAAYATAQLDAVAGIRECVEELDVDCALTPSAAFTYATEPGAAERAHREHAAAVAAGLPARWTRATGLPIEVAGAVRLDDQMHFDPGAFCAGIARRLDPALIGEHTVVRGVDEHQGGCTIALEHGTPITAAHVVLATQAPVVDPGFLANRCRPMQSYAIAARIDAPAPAGMYLSCDSSVRSVRPASIGGDPRLVVGGEGHPVGDDDARPDRWDALAAWTTGAFGPAEVTHRWATHDLVTTDRMPFIGRLVPGAHRRWVATGFAKWGMTNAYVAARLITEAIGGGSVPWAHAFDSTRVASTVNRQLWSLGRKTATHLVSDRLSRRGEPRCTHQGCVLRRDAALDTWDCPCHGSRFQADGSVVQGPATTPLAD